MTFHENIGVLPLFNLSRLGMVEFSAFLRLEDHFEKLMHVLNVMQRCCFSVCNSDQMNVPTFLWTGL